MSKLDSYSIMKPFILKLPIYNISAKYLSINILSLKPEAVQSMVFWKCPYTVKFHSGSKCREVFNLKKFLFSLIAGLSDINHLKWGSQMTIPMFAFIWPCCLIYNFAWPFSQNKP